MPSIKKLPFDEIQKIAAGQVVERPASVIKELVENAIDAQATIISVYIEDGGKKLMRVVDNGCGMDSIDAQLCFEKHATSKIESVDQLQTIETFGFRGEALASIAAVSNVTLITRHTLEQPGTKVANRSGTMTTTQATGNIGTDVLVENLFYNTPARLKFLKTTSTEQRHIVQLIHAFALSQLTVHFKLYADNHLLFNSSATDFLHNRLSTILSHSVTPTMLLPFSATRIDETIKIDGMITNHQYGAYDRSSIFCFVNGRWVKNHGLISAFIKGCKQVLPTGKFPAGFIGITVQKTLVDINTHPRKEEVAFTHPRVVENLIESTITKLFEDALSKHIPQPTHAHTSNQFFQSVTHSSSFFKKPFIENNLSLSNSGTTQKPDFIIDSFLPCDKNITQQAVEPLPQDKNVMVKDFNTYNVEQNVTPGIQNSIVYENKTIIGQLFNTYILIEEHDGLFLVDQHAAHERILYELFETQFKSSMTIPLLFAHIVPLAPNDMHYVDALISIFQDHGIGAELFGTQQLIIQSLPTYLKECQLNDLVHSCIQDLKEEKGSKLSIEMVHKIRAQMACKAAVKAGDVLQEPFIRTLLYDLSTCSNRFLCPHGRPIGWQISLDEIEKKFKRKL